MLWRYRPPGPLAICALLLAACEAPTGAGTLGDRVMSSATLPVGGPIPLLTAEQQLRFARGARLFDSVYTPETGLGPLYNGVSCASCHRDPVPGGGGPEVGLRASAFHDGVCDDLHGVGGPVIQLRVTPALHDALGIDREPIPPGATGTALRTTPAVWGAGLLDAVPDSTILALADPDDRDGDGVSGRPNRNASGTVGRFGRKADVATLWEFVTSAYLEEVGITNHVFPVEETVAGQPLPANVEVTSDTEIALVDLGESDVFARWLAPPQPAGSVVTQARGRAIFAGIGCATCHVPELRTRPNPALGLSQQIAAAYTDLLLHDMGPNLADICMGLALPSEFRTEPLWGLRFRKQFMHDGRAKTIEAAIELHAGEASGARERYRALSGEARATLLRFLGNL